MLKNLEILDVVVKMKRNYEIDKSGTGDKPTPPVVNYLFLADKNGVLLKTTDGYYLAVRKQGGTYERTDARVYLTTGC